MNIIERAKELLERRNKAFAGVEEGDEWFFTLAEDREFWDYVFPKILGLAEGEYNRYAHILDQLKGVGYHPGEHREVGCPHC